MNPTQPPNVLPPATPDKPAVEDAPAETTLRSRLLTALTTVLDARHALRRRLGRKTGELPKEANSAEREGPEAPHDEAVATPDESTESPRPRRRLRPVLIQGGILLAGCIGGGVLAYSLFQHQLGQQLKDSQRREAALAKQTQPVSDIRKALDAEKARRIAAEEKLAAAAAAYAKSTAEKQKALDAAETHPARLYLAEGSRPDGPGTRPLRSGDCTLDPKNIGALKRCIEEFNR